MSSRGKQERQQSLLLPDTTPAGGGATRRRRFVAFLVLAAALVASYHHFLAPAPASRYHALFLSLGSNATAAAHLRALTLRPHVAGTEANALAAEYVRAAFSSLSFPTRVTPYSVLLSYPVHRSLSLTVPGRAAANFALVQETYPGDPYAEAAAEVIPTYFAYSGSGSVAAEVVYANYGNTKDYAYLASRGVNVAGKVALVRYGNLHCEDMVRNARAAGAAAAIVYTDAKDYGGAGAGAKGKLKWFPDALWLPPTGVQVGTL
ncbi:hypothetical protein GUJ93_ZPchr0007g6059 [Zizania palustris]|uniref:PA domain-containing protein n=1 Tax=Zizania palustris TaxID=103762 RepID=A0A8J5T892_ZIZPA|nr:hypothetical protein GUJ93_ZPchr0007g6059 [Zizania palustris]